MTRRRPDTSQGELPLGHSAAASRDRPTGDILTVSQLHRRIAQIIERAIRTRVWVRGEVSEPEFGRGWVRFKLIQPGAAGTVTAIRAYLGRHDYADAEAQLAPASLADVLQAGTVITVRGYLAYWPRASRVDLQVDRVDPETSAGVIQQRRGELLAALQADGLTERQHTVATIPLAPLRVALVTGRDATIGAPDVASTLDASGFRVLKRLYGVALETAGAGDEIAAAIRRAERDGNQLILLVRGGGDSHRFSPFDSEAVAMAVAHAGVPVITGLGHKHNETLADEVAYQSCASPAAAAGVVIDQLRRAQRQLEDAAAANRHLAEQRRTAVRRRHRQPLAIATLLVAALSMLASALVGPRLGLPAVALLSAAALAWWRRRHAFTPSTAVPDSAATAMTFDQVLTALEDLQTALGSARTRREVNQLDAAAEHLSAHGASLLGVALPTPTGQRAARP